MFGRDLLGACPKEMEEDFRTEREKLIEEMPLEDEELVNHFFCNFLKHRTEHFVCYLVIGGIFRGSRRDPWRARARWLGPWSNGRVYPLQFGDSEKRQALEDEKEVIIAPAVLILIRLF